MRRTPLSLWDRTVADIESYGVERWLGELARDLKEGTYRPKAVRQVLIPKKQRGKFRALGICRNMIGFRSSMWLA